jgi:hypothetical protein
VVVLIDDPFTGADGAPWSGQWLPGLTGAGPPPAVADHLGGFGRLQAGGTNTQQFADICSRRAAGTSRDVAVRGVLRVDDEAYCRWYVRADQPSLDRGVITGYYVSLYYDGTARLGKSVAGVSTQLTGPIAWTPAFGSVWSFRYEVVNRTLQFKVWQGVEPAAWAVAIEDVSITAAGYLGPQLSSSGVATTPKKIFFDAVRVTDAATSTGYGADALVGSAQLIDPWTGAGVWLGQRGFTAADEYAGPRVWTDWLFPAAAAVAHTPTVADTLGLTDAVTPVLTGGGGALTETVGDPVGLVDQVSSALAAARTVADSVGLVDQVSSALAAVRTVADTVGLTDAAMAALTLARTAGDTAGFTDQVTPATDAARTIADSVGLTDTVTPVLTGAGEITRTVDDPLGLTDQATAALTLARTAGDTAGFTDQAVSALTAARTVPDSAGLTDAATAALAAARTAGDSMGLTDQVSSAVGAARTVTDSAGLTDNITAVITPANLITRTVADTLGLTDAVTPVLTGGGGRGTVIPAPRIGPRIASGTARAVAGARPAIRTIPRVEVGAR